LFLDALLICSVAVFQQERFSYTIYILATVTLKYQERSIQIS